MPPTLTVITPTLNAGTTIRQTLESVHAVAERSDADQVIEHIVVDGGSSDQTLDIVANHPSKPKILGDKGHGISAALNIGLASATGRFVAVLNADDYWEPEAMASVMKLLQASQKEDLIYYADIVQEDPVTHLRFERQGTLERLCDFMTLYHCSLFIPLSIHRELGNYDISYALAMDSEFVHRCLAANVEFEHIPLAIGVMRLRGRSHENTPSAMQEFERSVVNHKLKSPIKARWYRIRQTIFHTLHQFTWFQHLWRRANHPNQCATKSKGTKEL